MKEHLQTVWDCLSLDNVHEGMVVGKRALIELGLSFLNQNERVYKI